MESWLKPRRKDTKAVSEEIKSSLGLRAAGGMPFPQGALFCFRGHVLGGLVKSQKNKLGERGVARWWKRAVGRRSAHKSRHHSACKLCQGEIAEIQEVVAEGTDAQEMRTGAFRSKCQGVTWRELRELASSRGPAGAGHLNLELHGST